MSNGLLSRRALLVVTLASGIATNSCVKPAYHAGVVARLYRKGDYEGAIKRAKKVEAKFGEFPLNKKIVYAVYRGSAHLKLNQKTEAESWLKKADELAHAAPELLEPESKTLLEDGMLKLGLKARSTESSANKSAPESAEPENHGGEGDQGPAEPEQPGSSWETESDSQ